MPPIAVQPRFWSVTAAAVAVLLAAWFLVGDYPGLFSSCDFEPERAARISAWHEHWQLALYGGLALAAVCLVGWSLALRRQLRWLALVLIGGAALLSLPFAVGLLLLATLFTDFAFATVLTAALLFSLFSGLSRRHSVWWELPASALVFGGLLTLAVLGDPSQGAFVC